MQARPSRRVLLFLGSCSPEWLIQHVPHESRTVPGILPDPDMACNYRIFLVFFCLLYALNAIHLNGNKTN